MATIKAKRAAKIKLENPALPMGTIMREAGYSENTIVHPKDLTESKGWQELMKEYLPDEHLAEKHKEFLDSPREVRTYKRGELIEEHTDTSPQAVKALDMAYKLKGRYQDINVDKAIIINMTPSIADKYKPKEIERYDVSRETQEQPPSSSEETSRGQ